MNKDYASSRVLNEFQGTSDKYFVSKCHTEYSRGSSLTL
jgi:hypothetical protein